MAAPLWLSAVVLEELYAGARPADRRVLDRLEHDFERAQRILVPNLTDWVQTGVIPSRLGNRGYEQIGRARLTNDALSTTEPKTKSENYAWRIPTTPALRRPTR